MIRLYVYFPVYGKRVECGFDEDLTLPQCLQCVEQMHITELAEICITSEEWFYESDHSIPLSPGQSLHNLGLLSGMEIEVI